MQFTQITTPSPIEQTRMNQCHMLPRCFVAASSFMKKDNNEDINMQPLQRIRYKNDKDELNRILQKKNRAEVRKSFLLFVKILFKYIGDDELLREQCKLIVLRCRLEQSDLQQSVLKQLKEVVGQNIWNQAMIYYAYYRLKCLRQGIQSKIEQGAVLFPADMSEFLPDHDLKGRHMAFTHQPQAAHALNLSDSSNRPSNNSNDEDIAIVAI
jgi:hypothetical protein